MMLMIINFLNDFLNDFPPGLAGEGGRRKKIPKIRPGGRVLQQQNQQPTDDDDDDDDFFHFFPPK